MCSFWQFARALLDNEETASSEASMPKSKWRVQQDSDDSMASELATAWCSMLLLPLLLLLNILVVRDCSPKILAAIFANSESGLWWRPNPNILELRKYYSPTVTCDGVKITAVLPPVKYKLHGLLIFHVICPMREKGLVGLLQGYQLMTNHKPNPNPENSIPGLQLS